MEDVQRDNINQSAAHSEHVGWQNVAADAWGPQDRSTSIPDSGATVADTRSAQLDAVNNVLTQRFGDLDNDGNHYISLTELQQGATNPKFTPAEQSALKFAIEHYDQLRRLDDTEPDNQLLGINNRDVALLNHMLHPINSTDPYADGVAGDVVAGTVNGVTAGFGLGMTFCMFGGPPVVVGATAIGAVIGGAIAAIDDRIRSGSEEDFYASRRHMLELP